MMETKMLEIRDEGTFLPVMAFELDFDSEAEAFLLERAGYGPTPGHDKRVIVVWKMDGGYGIATSDAFAWTSRTMQVAHAHINLTWDTLKSGDVIDVQFVLGETSTKKISESKNG